MRLLIIGALASAGLLAVTAAAVALPPETHPSAAAPPSGHKQPQPQPDARTLPPPPAAGQTWCAKYPGRRRECTKEWYQCVKNPPKKGPTCKEAWTHCCIPDGHGPALPPHEHN